MTTYTTYDIIYLLNTTQRTHNIQEIDIMATIIKREDNDKHLIYEITTIGSLIDLLNQPTNGAFQNNRLTSMESNLRNNEWTKTSSIKDAMNLLQNGWTEESEKLTQILKLDKQYTPTISRRKTYQSVVGYTPMVPNYLMGIPTDMINTKMITTKQKVITLNKDISYPSMVQPNQIEESSIKCFQVVQSLEAQGIRCNLNIIWSFFVQGSPEVSKITVKLRIKSSDQLLNISKTSFPLVHPSMQRRICFRLLEVMPELTEKSAKCSHLIYGYGAPATPDEIKNYLAKKNEYYLPRLVDNTKELLTGLTQTFKR